MYNPGTQQPVAAPQCSGVRGISPQNILPPIFPQK